MSDTKRKLRTQEEIELRAYEIYLKRGGENGSALDDWLAAEKELSAPQIRRTRRKRAVPSPSVKRAATS